MSTAYERETQKKEFFISRCFWKLLFVCSVRWTVLMWTVAAKVTDRVIAKGRQRRTKLCQNLPNLSSFPVFHAKLRIPQDILTFRHLILHFTLFQIIGILLDMNWTYVVWPFMMVFGCLRTKFSSILIEAAEGHWTLKKMHFISYFISIDSQKSQKMV